MAKVTVEVRVCGVRLTHAMVFVGNLLARVNLRLANWWISKAGVWISVDGGKWRWTCHHFYLPPHSNQ